MTCIAVISKFVLYVFLIFLLGKPDTVVQTLPKMFIIRFGVWLGVGVQKFKMCWSRSGVGVYADEGGAESESKISESVHLWCPAVHNTSGVTAPFSHICSWCELHYILWIFAKIIFMIVLALNFKNEIWKSWSWSGNLKKTVVLIRSGLFNMCWIGRFRVLKTGVKRNFWPAKFLTSRHVRHAQSNILQINFAEKTDD